MSAEISNVASLPAQVVNEVKNQAKPATKDGIVQQVVGFGLGIPISMFYDWLFDLVASKVIDNATARNILKVALPFGVGVIVHVSKIPFGNLLAGTAYSIGIISLVKLGIAFIKGKLGKTTEETAYAVNENVYEAEVINWGVQ